MSVPKVGGALRQRETSFGVLSPFEIRSPTGEVLSRKPAEQELAVVGQSRGQALRIGGQAFPLGVVEIHPDTDGTLEVGGRRYRGILVLRLRSDGKIDLVNTLPMEAYLGGVLGGEMPLSWSDEARVAIPALKHGRPFEIETAQGAPDLARKEAS